MGVVMNKGERTREQILQKVAPIFNARGYLGTSLKDVIDATGLQKGGIYNHFSSKDALAVAAFDYCSQVAVTHLRGAAQTRATAGGKLVALVKAYLALLDEPLLHGGCPLLNTAVESDDTHPVLHARVQQAMDQLRGLFRHTVEEGIKEGALREVDAEDVTSVLISSIEGGIMMSKLYNDRVHLERVVRHLTVYIETSLLR
jgi:TetR/AcrR family transcriptional repressor of nem operon